MISRVFSRINYFQQLTIALALPHFSFRNLDAFAQANPDFGKTQSRQKSFVAHTRHPEPVLSTALKCSARMGNVRHPCRTRVSKFYLTQGSMELEAEGIFAESFKKLSHYIAEF